MIEGFLVGIIVGSIVGVLFGLSLTPFEHSNDNDV